MTPPTERDDQAQETGPSQAAPAPAGPHAEAAQKPDATGAEGHTRGGKRPRHTPLRVTHLITGLHTGGAELMLHKLLSGMDRSRFSLEVISMTSPGPVAEKIKALGIPVYSLEMKRGVPSPAAVARLSARLLKTRPHILQTWLYHADLLGSVVARLCRVPILCWNIRNSTLEEGKSRSLTIQTVKLCARLSHHLPDRILCCSHMARDLHVEWGYDAGRMHIIPNGFDVSAFKPDADARAQMRQTLDIPIDALVVGLVGRYDPQKDHAGFVKSAEILSRRLANVYFVMVGDKVTPENTELQTLISKSGLEQRFRLLGRRSDIAQLTAGFDVAASSSAYGEAFSNVLGEAMSCGIPCVATDVGDARLIIDDTGLVVPPREPFALAAALEKLLSLPAGERTHLGERARTRVRENFSLSDIIQRYEATYEELARACVD